MDKILFFTEVPTAHLDEMDHVIDGHFCIASECLKDPKYYDWFRTRTTTKPVMLDNGMFEEGKPLSVDDLLDIVPDIRPSIVFAPDQVGDRKLTLEMSKEFSLKIRERGHETQVAFIPQGATEEEVALCYGQMYTWMRGFQQYPVLGISFLNRRNIVVDHIYDIYGGLFPTPHHFLGMYHTEEISHWPEEVFSMDTIKPFKAAFHGYNLEACPRGLGKWNTHMDMPENRRELMFRNIAKMHSCLVRR